MTVKSSCGVFCFHPGCLQKCGSLGCFVFAICLTTLASQSLLVYLVTQTPFLQRQFGLEKYHIEIILYCNEIGFTLFGLLMGFLAPRVHIPKFLCFSAFLIGVSALLCAVPHFVSESHLKGEATRRLAQLPTTEMLDLMRQLEQQQDPFIVPFVEPDGENVTTASSKNESGSQNNSSSLGTNSSAFVTTSPTPNGVNVVPGGPNPFLPLLTKFKELVGDDLYQSLTQEAGFVEGSNPGMREIKQLAKIIASRDSVMEMLPAADKQRLLMFSRISKRDTLFEPSDLGELDPFHFVAVVAPRCTGKPKQPDDCAILSKLVNKGFTNKYTGLSFALLSAAMVLQGIAKSAFLPMTLLYFDDNGSKTKTSMYLGFLMVAVCLGVIVGAGTGVLTSKVNTEFMEDLAIHPLNFHWIGAWWLGFILIAAVVIVTAMPLICFPKRFRLKQRYTEYSDTDDDESSDDEPKTNYCSSLKRCFCNPVLMGLQGCVIVSVFWLSGETVYNVRYLETQFTLPIWLAHLAAASSKLVPAMLGSLLTGIVVIKLSPFGMLKVGFFCGITMTILGIVSVLFGCDTVDIIGFNAERVQGNLTNTTQGNLVNTTAVASACFCDGGNYFPVCGSDGRNYFSPCHAGCTGNNDEVLTGCSCTGEAGTGTIGLCKEESCGQLGPHLAMTGVISFLMAASGLIYIIVGLRSVANKDRSTAIALFITLSNLLGWIPAQVLIKKLVPFACGIRRHSCPSVFDDACAVYDNWYFRIGQHAFSVVLFIVMTLFLWFALFNARDKTDWNSTTITFEGQTEVKYRDNGPRSALMKPNDSDF